MSITNIREQQPQPPRPRQVAMPPMRPPPTHADYADEAKRAAQRYIDQVNHIEHLTAEVEQWRSRAIVGDREIGRLQQREADLLAEMEDQKNRQDRDSEAIKQTLAVVAAQYASAAKILLDGFAAIDRLGGIRAKISLTALERTITEAQTEATPQDAVDEAAAHVGERMPSVVTRGPDYGNE
jgi:hypothetical protein